MEEKTTLGNKVYDLLIIGAGPAGLSASIYASRYKISNLIIATEIGGTIAKAHMIQNYPGYVSILGMELGQKMVEQTKNLGAEIKIGTVVEITKSDNFNVKTNNGDIYYSKSIVIASGTERRKLNIPGETEYLGKGISYCTNCDAPFFKNKKVAVVGGGDAAVTGALHVKEFASEAYLIYRKKKEEMKAEPMWIDQLEKKEVKCLYETDTVEVLGDKQKVNGLKLTKPFEGNEILSVDGIFIEIGATPVSKLISNLGVKIDESGFIMIDDGMKTNIEGVYAAGDITTKSKILTQAITAAAQGAMAAATAFKDLKGKEIVPKQWG